MTGQMPRLRNPRSPMRRARFVLRRARLWIKRALDRRSPTQRARTLLRRHLDLKQRREFDRCGRFKVIGVSGSRYVIDLHSVRSGPRIWCIQSTNVVPQYDLMLMRKLLIECDEQAFLATARSAMALHFRGARVDD
jgi:hypothetical protein